MNTIIPFSVSSAIDKAATLKIACVPIGHISQAKFEQRVSTIEKLAQALDHSRITDANSPSSSPFTSFNQPSARLEVTVLTLPSNVFSESLDDRYDLFISLIQNSEWDEFVPLNHVFAVLGIADGETSESMEECYKHYASLKAALPSNQSALPTSASSFALTSAPSVSAPKLPFRCQFFAFGFDYDGLGYDDAITVPLDSDDRALSYASACLHGLVSNLMHDAECWVGDVIKSEQTLVLKSPLDLGAINQSMLPSSSSPLNALESITAKVRKQRIGRQQKAIGDLCLVFGCPSDALIHIRQAVDCLKSCSDSPWLASAYESQAAALFASEKRGSAKVFNESILQLLTDSAAIYASLPGAAALCITSSFKLARYLAMHTRVTEAIDLLMRTNELPLDLSAHHQVELAVNAGKLAAEMGAMRKFAFLIVQASAVYEELHQYVAAIRMLRFAMPVYGLDELNRSLEYGSGLPRSTVDESEVTHIQCRWPGIQRTLLEHFVFNCVKCEDYLSAIQATVLLQKCVAEHELLDENAQVQLNTSLLHLTATLPVDLLVRDCGIPTVNFIRPVMAHPDRQPIRSTWHQDSEQSTSNDVFLFNPADSKSGQSGSSSCLTFSAKDPIVFEVSLDNPLSVVCEIQKLTLSGLSCGFRSHCTGFFVAPRSKDQRFLVTCTTDHAGVLKITGCHMRCFNMTQVVEVDQFGFNTVAGTAAKLAKECASLCRVDNMEILYPLPLLLVSVTNNNNLLLDGQTLFENESASGYVQLTSDGSVDVEHAELKIFPLFAALSAQSQAAYYSQAELEAEQALRVRRKSSAAVLERPSTSTLSFDSNLLSSFLPLRAGHSVKLPFRMLSSSGLIGLQLSLTYSSQKTSHYCRRLERRVSWLTAPIAEIKQVQMQSIDAQTAAMSVLIENFSNQEICIMLQVDGIEIGLLSSQVVKGCEQTRLIFTISRFDPSLVDSSFPTGDEPVTVERICASIMKRLRFSWSTVRGIVRHGQLPVLWRFSQEQIRALVKPFARITCDIPGRCCIPPQDCEWISISTQPRVALGEPIDIRINATPLVSPAMLLFECLDVDVLVSGSPNVELESIDDQREVEHVIGIVILSPGKHNFTAVVKPASKLSEIYQSKALFCLTGV